DGEPWTSVPDRLDAAFVVFGVDHFHVARVAAVGHGSSRRAIGAVRGGTGGQRDEEVVLDDLVSRSGPATDESFTGGENAVHALIESTDLVRWTRGGCLLSG